MADARRVTVHPFTTEAEWLALRAQDITSTESAALVNASPYLTPYELWHVKRGLLPSGFVDTERTRWGRALQDAIANEVAAANGWQTRRMDEYLRDGALRMGSSFDNEVICPTRGKGLMEIKNVDRLVFRDQWVAGDEPEAPLHIEVQVQHQLDLAKDLGYTWAVIVALVGGNEAQLIYRRPDRAIGRALRERIAAFWSSTEPPAPDYMADAGTIAQLYGAVTPGSFIDLSGNAHATDLAVAYRAAADAEKAASEVKKAAHAELLTLIGDAEKAKLAGFKISAARVEGGPVSYVREAYRGWRLTQEKVKA